MRRRLAADVVAPADEQGGEIEIAQLRNLVGKAAGRVSRRPGSGAGAGSSGSAQARQARVGCAMPPRAGRAPLIGGAVIRQVVG